MAKAKKIKSVKTVDTVSNIEITGPARIAKVDRHRTVVILENASESQRLPQGLISGTRMMLGPGMIPEDFEFNNYEVKGSYVLKLEFKKK